jgi:hypothetical protein
MTLYSFNSLKAILCTIVLTGGLSLLDERLEEAEVDVVVVD